MLQGDVDDLYRCLNVTDRRSWWLECVVAAAGHIKVGAQADRGTAITDAKGVTG